MAEKSICIKAYAKINLHLDITGKMGNGFHSVNTVMQTVSLCDDVKIILSDEPCFDAECNVIGVPSDEKNIAVRAAKLFCESADLNVGAHIIIDKKIPMAAGMAGGSADAAAVFIGMNHLFGDVFLQDELCKMAGTLGSDVPFCIVGGTLYADGKGDILYPFPQMPDCGILIACEGEGVSTPWAYKLLDSLYRDFDAQSDYIPRNIEPLKIAVESKNISDIARATYNIFEIPVLDERPVALNIRDIMKKEGAIGAMMSGSGPSVFGIFDDGDKLDRASEVLASFGYRSYKCRPITPTR